MEIKQTSENQWQVTSDSGNTYTVKFLGMDTDEHELRRWSCDCQAGDHGKRCKHQVAVAEMTAREADRDGLDSGMGDIFGCRPERKPARSFASRYGC